jgi:hypothetical protein
MTEGFFGISLITASVSWIVLIFPALGRMRTLARRTILIAQAADQTGVNVVSGEAQYLLAGLAEDIIRTGVDLIHYPIIYYFYAANETASFPKAIKHLLRFAEAAAKPENDKRVRLASELLRLALDDLARILRERFIGAETDDPKAVFETYAEHHSHR